MKNLISILLVAAAVAGCQSPYDYMENWLIRDDAVRPFFVPVDVIYAQDRLYDNMNDVPDMRSVAMAAVGRGKFSGIARVFSPLIASEEDAEAAVKWYLKHHNSSDRPFALIGEGKGGSFLKAYAEKNTGRLEDKGLIASFFSAVPDRNFVSDEMVSTIKNRATRERYRRQWGREMPDGMLGQ